MMETIVEKSDPSTTLARLDRTVLERTMHEIRAEAPGIDEVTVARVMAEIAETYPGFVDGSSNALDGEEGAFDARRAIRHSRMLTRTIFGVDPYPSLFPSFWDSSTLQVKRALDRYVGPSDRMIEIGVGHVAINCLYLLKKFPGMDLHGVDINPEVVANAIKVAQHNGLSFVPIQSNMWQNVTGTYSRLLFNAPYIPSSRLDHATRAAVPTWVADGGDDGLQAIRLFAGGIREHCRSDAKVLLGINAYFVEVEPTVALFTARGFQLHDTIRQPPFNNQVLVFTLA